MPKIEQVHSTFDNRELLDETVTSHSLALMLAASVEDYAAQQSVTPEQAKTLLGVFDEVGEVLTDRLATLESQGFNHEQLIGAVMQFGHGLQVDVADTMYEEHSPLLRMAWLAQQQRIMSHHTLFGTLYRAHLEGNGDHRETGKAVWDALYDKPVPYEVTAKAVMAAVKAQAEQMQPAPTVAGPDADDITNAIEALRVFGPKIKDSALRAKLEATIQLGESIVRNMKVTNEPEPEQSGVIEITGDFTVEEAALRVQAEIKAATGRELPLNELQAALRKAEANGFSVAAFPKE